MGGNFTFLILTDRDDLDTQIYKTFAGCGLVDNDRDPCRASGREHLEELLHQHKSFVFSLIQKFHQDVNPDKGYSQRDDIIVITDEAHRTQYGRLALNLRNALPNASYIGFTGTPLFKDDEITRRDLQAADEMHQGPAVLRGDRISHRRVPLKPEADFLEQHAVWLVLDIWALQIRRQRGKALPDGSLAVVSGTVAHDAEGFVFRLPFLEDPRILGKRIFQGFGRR